MKSNIAASQIHKELATFPFFNTFPQSRLAELSGMMKISNFLATENVLTQGEENNSLYFLRKGDLEVLVDGEIVGHLNATGEIFGEMSLVTHSKVKASVRALNEVSVFCVSEANFQHLPEHDQIIYKNLMNHVLTQVLVLRLDRTNDRAKRFEATNKELQKSQENLKDLNQKLENEIVRRSKELVDKVKSISETQLSTTAKSMNQAITEQVVPDSMSMRRWTDSINEAVEFLKPVIDLSDRKGQNTIRRVYLCESDKRQQSLAKLALGGTGVTLEVFEEESQMIKALSNAPADLAIIDGDAKMADAVATIKKQWPEMPLVIMLGQDIFSYLELLKRFPTHPYFVARNPKNRTLTIKSLTITVAKILNHDFFGLEKYLSWGSHVVEAKITRSDKRNDEIEKMKEHFSAFGVRATFLDQAHQVADEMLMNAIYDAPTDQSGVSLYNHLSRVEVVELPEDHAVTLRYGTDGIFLAVSVVDPYGALTKNILQNYLQKNFQGEETSAAGKGGAGKGLYMIITGSDFVVFNVKPKQKTEVICFFQLERIPDDDPKPTFHLFF